MLFFRNTPQAFSHFTYELSKRKSFVAVYIRANDTRKCILEVEGVHTKSKDDGGSVFNLGQLGITRFVERHRCNIICQYLKLENVERNLGIVEDDPPYIPPLNEIRGISYNETAPLLGMPIEMSSSKGEKCACCCIL